MALHQLALDDADLRELMFSEVVRQHAVLDRLTEHHELYSSLALMNRFQAQSIMHSKKRTFT